MLDNFKWLNNHGQLRKSELDRIGRAVQAHDKPGAGPGITVQNIAGTVIHSADPVQASTDDEFPALIIGSSLGSLVASLQAGQGALQAGTYFFAAVSTLTGAPYSSVLATGPIDVQDKGAIQLTAPAAPPGAQSGDLVTIYGTQNPSGPWANLASTPYGHTLTVTSLPSGNAALPPTGYAWQEATWTGSGWTPLVGGRSGNQFFNPAFEDNNTPGVALGAQVWMRQEGPNTYSFWYGHLFGGGGSIASAGLVPTPGPIATGLRFLCDDRTWKAPTGGSSGAAVRFSGARVLPVGGGQFFDNRFSELAPYFVKWRKTFGGQATPFKVYDTDQFFNSAAPSVLVAVPTPGTPGYYELGCDLVIYTPNSQSPAGTYIGVGIFPDSAPPIPLVAMPIEVTGSEVMDPTLPGPTVSCSLSTGPILVPASTAFKVGIWTNYAVQNGFALQTNSNPTNCPSFWIRWLNPV
jgi:hypothetical protein